MAGGRRDGRFVPDPLSLLWEQDAARVLQIAVAARGRWYGTYVADPTVRQAAYASGLGIGLGADRLPGRKAKTRWCRAFTRALERQRKAQGLTVEWQVGNRLPALGGRAFRIRTRAPGDGQATGKPEAARIFDDAGAPAGRWSDPEDRDW